MKTVKLSDFSPYDRNKLELQEYLSPDILKIEYTYENRIHTKM